MLFVLATILLIGILGFKYGRKTTFSPKLFARDLVLFGVGLFAIAAIFKSVTIVPAGHRGVVFDRITGVRSLAMKEGLNFIIPVFQDAIIFDVRVQKETVKVTAASKDLQDVSTEVVINYRPSGADIPIIYKEYGLDFVDKVISPAVQEAVKAVTAQYTAEQLVTDRAEVKVAVHKALSVIVKKANLLIVETYMTDFKFSKAFANAIEAKQVAEQDALKAERELEKIKIQAQQKIETAKAEAMSLKLQRQQISPLMIELRKVEVQGRAIDKWNGIMPRVVIGGDGNSTLLNLGGLSETK